MVYLMMQYQLQTLYSTNELRELLCTWNWKECGNKPDIRKDLRQSQKTSSRTAESWPDFRNGAPPKYRSDVLPVTWKGAWYWMTVNSDSDNMRELGSWPILQSPCASTGRDE